ncbi:MAG: sulfatase-like hydrolase/transferase [Verrucomicrobia bacterium]|nr:sulfatase-like hydrolase/transferase [Verrucomicrobiota bacterium]MDA1069496.1 sulfatase-like hydrolase/transferase [Verrucomicrobiota bacterium]
MPRFLTFILCTVFLTVAFQVEFLGQKPNVVFIIVDDLNDMPLQPGGKPLVPTPNIDRLKERGVSFTNAHTNDPLCAPSRASMLFGLYPQTTSLYWFEDWRDNGILKESVSLHDNLRNGGYAVFGTGKIYHGSQTGLFDEYGHNGDVGPWPWDGQSTNFRLPHPQQLYLYHGPDSDMDYQWEHVFGPLSDVPVWPADVANGIPGYTGWRLFGKPWKYVNDQNRDPMADELGAQWSKEIINRDHSKPFALFTGLIRTHTPLYAPKNYFDRFPLDTIKLPQVDPNDLDDVAEALGNEALYGFRRYKMLVRHEGKDLLRHWLQAYMACVSFIDDQVGTILDAVDASPYRDNTIVIFTSDHGFHVGEKGFLYKGSLWEPSTRIPFIVAGVPGAPEGVVCDQPVSLIDMYPTFNELCGLSKYPNEGGNGYELEGHSLVPLIKNPGTEAWTGPDVAITALPGKDHMLHADYEGSLYPHFSVRSKRWRYSLTSNGGEELYDHHNDPLEWKNLANDPELAFVKSGLKAELIELREGDKWESLNQLSSWTMPSGMGESSQSQGEIRLLGTASFDLSTSKDYEDFEFEADLKTSNDNSFRIAYRGSFGNGVSTPVVGKDVAGHAHFQNGEWNRYRIRVHDDRHQVWINNRVVSDLKIDSLTSTGALRIIYPGGGRSLQLRNARIREL